MSHRMIVSIERAFNSSLLYYITNQSKVGSIERIIFFSVAKISIVLLQTLCLPNRMFSQTTVFTYLFHGTLSKQSSLQTSYLLLLILTATINFLHNQKPTDLP
jgi:hypothetical protein